MKLEERQTLVRKAARAIGRANLAHAYGHCSSRIDESTFLVCAAEPMGMIAPGLDGTLVPVSGPLPNGVLGEVRIHQKIYQKRPDLYGICRTMPSNAMALAALGKLPKVRHGFGSYFSRALTLWDDPQLLRNDEHASKLADQFGAGRGILMRGNGAVVGAESLERAVVLTWYLEDACRLELEALRCGLADNAPTLSHDEALARATDKGRIYERMWDYLTEGDPE
jgi:HCOMODA/2-hydroxy-3-carboxy-muconic semialdehyde decarboxylase